MACGAYSDSAGVQELPPKKPPRVPVLNGLLAVASREPNMLSVNSKTGLLAACLRREVLIYLGFGKREHLNLRCECG